MSAARPFYSDAMRAWLHGYQPVLADEMLAGRSAVRDRENARLAREAQMANGTGWRSGSMHGLSKNADAQIAAMKPRRKKVAA